jgi:hypothetical protein
MSNSTQQSPTLKVLFCPDSKDTDSKDTDSKDTDSEQENQLDATITIY